MTLTPEQEARRREMIEEAGVPAELKPIAGLVANEELLGVSFVIDFMWRTFKVRAPFGML